MTITYKNKALDSIKADATIVVLEKKANFKKVLPEGEYKLLEEVGFLNEDTDSFYLPHIRTLFVKVDGVDGEEIKTVAANSYKALKKYKKNVQGKSLTFLEIIGSCEVKDIPLTFLFLPVRHSP